MQKYLMAAAAATTLMVAVPATAANLITNGGFENGSTNGNGNYNIPNGWTPNAAFTAYMSNGAVATSTHSGDYSLRISNLDNQPLAALSQTFATVLNGIYTVSFYFQPLPGVNSDPAAFLQVSAANGSVSFMSNEDPYAFTLGSFSFIGTGSDTLTIAAQSNRNSWLVDDVSVTGGEVPPVSGAVPEPATWAMMLFGFGMVGCTLRRRPLVAAQTKIA